MGNRITEKGPVGKRDEEAAAEEAKREEGGVAVINGVVALSDLSQHILFLLFSLSFFLLFLSLCLFSFIPLACTTMTDSLKSSILFFSFLNLIIFSGLFCPTKRHYFVQFGRPYLITWTPHFLQRHLCPLYYLENSHTLSVIRLPVA